MKNQLVIFGLFIILCSCESLKYPISAYVSQVSDCKNSESFNVQGLVSREPVPDTLSCVQYSYDKDKQTLMLQHINAGFNCCPKKIKCEIKTINDTIELKAIEEEAMCDCNCLYDITFTISDLPPGKYVLKFIEPYVGNSEKLIFNVDLNKLYVGEFCFARKSYPWGM